MDRSPVADSRLFFCSSHHYSALGIVLRSPVFSIHLFKESFGTHLHCSAVRLRCNYMGGSRWANEHRHQRLADQQSASSLDAINDEPLLTAKGPIGVRLHYWVNYPKGLDMDEGHGAFAIIGRERLAVEFTMLRRSVIRMFRVHLLPANTRSPRNLSRHFFRIFFWTKINPDLYGRCFRFNSGIGSQEVLSGEAQSLTFFVYLLSAPVRVTSKSLPIFGFLYYRRQAGGSPTATNQEARSQEKVNNRRIRVKQKDSYPVNIFLT